MRAIETMFPAGVPLTKRLFDFVASLAAVILLSPVLGVVGILVLASHGWPVIFRQRRAGYRGRLFDVYKFRTMTNARDAAGALLPDEQRLTRLGRALRSTSLDELPELFNVLRGEMSLVGPRPLFARYRERYSPEQARRLDALPGITGWAQINGRNTLTWEDRFRLDIWYVDHWSFGLDLKIIFQTVAKVLRREGISPSGQEIMPEFMGTPAPSPDPAEGEGMHP